MDYRKGLKAQRESLEKLHQEIYDRHKARPDPDDPTEFLVRRVLAKDMKRVAFDYDEFFKARAYQEYDRIILGTMTATDMKNKVRYIDHSLFPYTKWEVAREYVKWIFESQAGERTKRIGWNKKTWNLLDISQPIYWNGVAEGELAYVDLKHAFHQIYSPATLDLFFDPWEGAFGLGHISFLYPDWLERNRTIRNAIVGITRSREHDEWRTDWKNHQHKPIGHGEHGPRAGWGTVRTYNKYLAPELWGYLAFMLHHIAISIDERFDLHYVHTDGYIVPADQADRLVEFLAEFWMMDAGIKAQGNGKTTGVGRWEIGDQGTKNYGIGEPTRYIMDQDPAMTDKLVRWREQLLSS